jgi:LuxR family transcriptional regulator, maltose regulon positive regulatory protein
VRLGEAERAERALAELDGQDRECGEIRVFAAKLRLAPHDPHAATVALGPVLDGSAPVCGRPPLIRTFALEAIARDALNDAPAAGRALERALYLAQPDGVLLVFLLHHAPALLHRHARHRTARAALIAQILNLMARVPAPPPARMQPPLSRSAEARSGFCGTCQLTCPCQRSRTNSTFR